jgi:type VI secretion system protein ImpK
VRLVDCFIEVLSFTTLYLRRPGDDYKAFRSRVMTLLNESKSRSQGAGFDADEYQNALFAVVAWIDEAVMTTQEWEGTAKWRKELLQQAYFATGRAGIEFFNRLDQLVAHQQSVREVYYFCLMLGFKGRYVTLAQERALDDIKAHHLAMLVRDAPAIAVDEDAVLFPAAYPPAEAPRKVSAASWSPSKTSIVMAVAPLAVLLVIYLTYQLVLGSMASSVASLVS